MWGFGRKTRDDDEINDDGMRDCRDAINRVSTVCNAGIIASNAETIAHITDHPDNHYPKKNKTIIITNQP